MEKLFLPGNHNICFREVTLSVVRVQDSGGQNHLSFHRNHSSRSMHTHTSTHTGTLEMRTQLSGTKQTAFYILTCTPTPRLSRTPPQLDLQGGGRKREMGNRNLQRMPQMGVILRFPASFIKLRFSDTHTNTHSALWIKFFLISLPFF